jgi:hypothetical protein
VACWFHSLAKLKMHTEATLLGLHNVTTLFGQHMRRFKSKLCDQIQTLELDREVAARARRLARENPVSLKPTGGKKTKEFNLYTYKFHALGDYVSSILKFGTTDSYSTQIVSQSTIFHISYIYYSCSRSLSIVHPKDLILEPAEIILPSSLPLSSVVRVTYTVLFSIGSKLELILVIKYII